jgi:hypothetical protein
MSNVERDLAETMFGRDGLLLLVLRLKFVERPLLAQSGRSCARLQPRSLLSIASLNMARSRARPLIWSFVRLDQTCLGRGDGLAPVSLPLLQGTVYEASW